MRDLDAREMALRLWINEKILNVFKLYGFKMVEPTAIEHLTTLEAKSGPAIRDEIYWFKDKAQRDLGLRFDLTVGMTRMVANDPTMEEPIKLASISNMWRYDEPQFARYRSFYQWDAEIYGSANPEADAEIICLAADVIEAFHLRDYEIRFSNRKLIEGFLDSVGVPPNSLDQTFRVIDKYRKIGEEEFTRELQTLQLDRSQIGRIRDFIFIRGDPEDALRSALGGMDRGEKTAQGESELKGLIEALKAYGRLDRCILDLSIVRGLGYYDGTVFEAYDRGSEDVGAIAGGGRYDGLCRLYGKRDMPATGVAGGIERLIISLERAVKLPELALGPTVFVAYVNDSVRSRAWRLAQQLRVRGIACETELKRRSLRRQLEYCDSQQIPRVVIVGPRELQENKVKLRDMKTENEREVLIDSLPDEVLKGI
jgi:histidyl-tRNA synthetase